MDRQQEIQESFNKFFQSLFPGEGQPITYLSSISSAMKKANQCLSKGQAVAEENNVVASEYYCLASFVCLVFILENGMTDSLYERGSQAAKQAFDILPKDYEYLVFTLFYRVLAINVDEEGADDSFSQLQQIHHECPPFHIIDNALFKPEWLEDNFNQQFEIKLQEVCLKIDEESGNWENAALLLKTCPGITSKLLAFYDLSKIYLSQDKDEEALRNAKLGVELLGNNVEYDYHIFNHWLWGECWALVGNINRKKKEFDFAEGILEKGARLGIISCITSLSEMYETGESDDPDPKEAERYRNLAKTTQEARDKEIQEEKERIRQREETRLAEIHRQEEEQRLAEELEARKEEIKRKKSLLWAGIAACAIGIIAGIINLSTENIVDRVAEYEKAGLAILDLEQSSYPPYTIIMDRNSIFYDNLSSTFSLLPVGKYVNTQEVELLYDGGGLKAIVEDSDQKLAIIHSQSYNIIQLSTTSFLLTKTSLDCDPMTTPNMEIDQCYLLMVNPDSRDSSNNTVIMVPKGKTDGRGNLEWQLSNDILKRYGADFKSSFQRTEYKKIVERQYGHYLATISLSLTRGTASIISSIVFDKLKQGYSPNEVGTTTHRESMKNTIRQIFRNELIESFYANAAEITGVRDKNNMRISPDDKYTFVIKPHFNSGSQEKIELLRVNNQTKEKIFIDSAIEVEYQEYRIRVRKYKTFLIFFDSYNDIYYNYSGTQIN